MLSITRVLFCFFSVLSVSLWLTQAAEPAADGFVAMFNGKDLTGWVNVNTAPGTFYVKDGETITNGNPTGFLRTDKQYENFELEMDWMHVNRKEVGNSGLFVWGDPIPAVGTGYTRGIEVQVLVNYETDWATSQGDLFSIWGAHCKPDRPHPKGYERCLPSEKRCKGGGEWNHYKVIANDGAIKLHVNGKEVSGVSKCTPRKGYLALESEGAECHFKNIKIKELPTTNPKPEDVANVAAGHKSLFDGLTLTGWKKEEGAWKAGGGKFTATGKGKLQTEAKFTRGELVFDWKVTANTPADHISVVFGEHPLTFFSDGKLVSDKKEWKIEKLNKPGAWNRIIISDKGISTSITVNGYMELITSNTIIIGEKPKLKELPPEPIQFTADKGVELMNVFYREATKPGKGP